MSLLESYTDSLLCFYPQYRLGLTAQPELYLLNTVDADSLVSR